MKSALRTNVRTALVIIPALALFVVSAVCEIIADTAGNAAAALGRWADR